MAALTFSRWRRIARQSSVDYVVYPDLEECYTECERRAALYPRMEYKPRRIEWPRYDVSDRGEGFIVVARLSR
jgi:hypothetical protein